MLSALRVIAIHAKCQVGMFQGLGPVVLRESVSEVALLAAPGRISVCRQVIGIEPQRVCQKAQGPLGVRRTVRMGVRQGPQIEIVGIEAVGAFAARARDLGLPDGGLDNAGDLLDEAFLEIEEIGDHPLEAFGPDVNGGCTLDQMAVDLEPISGPSDAPAQQIADSQLGGHLPVIDLLPAIGEGGIARDDEEAGDPREAGDQILHEAIGKVALLAVLADRPESQHGNRRPVHGETHLCRQRQSIATFRDCL